ncbi:MAG: hypothetical protein IT374_26875 [Polyangiaceae bacterium]|nr:hypothetical protein [Polyangiaceae bacterium]
MWPRLALSSAASAGLLIASLGAATLAVEAGAVAGRERASAVALAASMVAAVVVAGRGSRGELVSAALAGPALGWGAARALDAVVISPLDLSARAGSALAVLLGLSAFVSTEARRRSASARASGGP